MKLSAPPVPTRRRAASDIDGSLGPLGWELALAGDLTEKQKELSDALVNVPYGSRGVVYFDSCGGSVYVGLALATLMRLRGLQVTGVVAGECSSAAILPFASCQRRLTTSHATFFFHQIRWTGKEDLSADEAVEWTRYMRELEGDMDDLTAKFFGVPPEKLAGWTRPGRFITGMEMIAAGLAQPIDLFSGDLVRQISHA